jgi:phosphatidylglycerophosphate synthase
VLGFCLACFFWLHRFTLAALFIMVGLGIFISFHRIVAQARSSDRRD